ncbi:alpha/beta hydrolase [Massilia sp. CFBP9012]|uniref:alpha/beta hydrolase n=1 Tax=Massilia sp. CFBP9012 TaxID=3096531 RepID=UPI002A6A7398|nr:alpha/beta hydrolase [Massilia sp. CFBP9012]MDY0974877.1 alpha/beta hydrolase [Massilia sp. CFBP9012]
MTRKHLALAWTLFLAMLLYTSLAAALEPCHLPNLPERVECGTLEVPEDRANPAGRRITIHFARIKATAKPAAPDPLLVLAGGPGQAATDYGPLLASAFREARKRRDILLVDQRGTGRSSPLRCPMPEQAIARGDTASAQASLRACLAALEADPRHFHTEAALADFEDLRRALGYRQFSLWGGSYGTRTALMYARRYPGSVRGMVLDSVAPPNARILLSSRHAQAALERLLADCAADEGCARAFPNLARELDAVLALPSLGPHQAAAVPQLLRGAMYSAQHASVLPFAIHAAANGRPQPLLALYDALAGWSLEGMTFGQTLSVLCAEEAPFTDAAAMREDGAGSRFGEAYARGWRDWCAVWPAARFDPRLSAELTRAVTSDIPTLLLAGGLDPVTPPENAHLAARTLRHSRVLVAAGAGHTFSGAGCAPRLIAAFLEHAIPAAVDGACLAAIRRPPFVLADGQPTL